MIVNHKESEDIY